MKNTSNKFRPIKAYKNVEFLNSPAARNIRILSEMMEPADRLRRHKIRDLVVFFGSARTPSPEKAKAEFNIIKNKLNNSHTNHHKLKTELEFAQTQLKMSEYYAAAEELSYKLTKWFKHVAKSDRHLVICSGGGPGIMEAANKGAKKAKGLSMGLNISLPMEQFPNPYIDKELSFEFHYFFIRKFWFLYLSKCIVAFPGGFGTLDEFFEVLTLIQTGKTKKHMPIILFGSEYWNEVINFNKLLKWGTISKEDLNLFKIYDDVDEAFEHIKKEITKYYLKSIKYSKDF